LPGRFRQFELDWLARLLLSDGRTVGRIPARRQIINFKVTTSQPRSSLLIATVNIARSLDLELGSDWPNVLWTEGRLRADDLPPFYGACFETART
jgi:hypothetical protein